MHARESAHKCRYAPTGHVRACRWFREGNERRREALRRELGSKGYEAYASTQTGNNDVCEPADAVPLAGTFM